MSANYPKKRRVRPLSLMLVLCGIAVAVALALLATSENVTWFRTPTEVAAGKFPEAGTTRNFRLGGIVKPDSINQEAAGTIVFTLTDATKAEVTVRYSGIVPNLFAPSREAVVEGRMAGNGIFQAKRVLAKHDERYYPMR